MYIDRERNAEGQRKQQKEYKSVYGCACVSYVWFCPMYFFYWRCYCSADTHVHQLFEISLIVPPFWPPAWGLLTIFKRPLVILWQNFIVDNHDFPCPKAFFLASTDFPNYPKDSAAHSCWSHSNVSRRYMQITYQTEVSVVSVSIRWKKTQHFHLMIRRTRISFDVILLYRCPMQ